MAIGGHQVGPVSEEEIISNIRNGSMQPGTLVFTAGMTDWTPVKQVETFLFAGEGIFFASLTGPGKVWLQSLPLSRPADRIYKAIPSMGRSRTDEGGIPDKFGIGNLIDGD